MESWVWPNSAGQRPYIPPKNPTTNIKTSLPETNMLWMEEILHHLGCIKLCKSWDIYHINWCRSPSINGRTRKWMLGIYYFLLSYFWGHFAYFMPIFRGEEWCELFVFEGNIATIWKFHSPGDPWNSTESPLNCGMLWVNHGNFKKWKKLNTFKGRPKKRWMLLRKVGNDFYRCYPMVNHRLQ